MHTRTGFLKIAALALLSFGLLNAQGQTWTPTGPTNSWTSAASSADGTVLIVGAVVGRQVVTSTNAGTTWHTNTQLPSIEWTSVACSADGSILLAASSSGPIYRSTNSGSLWATSNVPSKIWSSAAMSGDGNILMAIVSQDNPPIFVSTNGGAAWTSNSIVGMPSGTVACSADGSRLMALTDGSFYFSTNYGVNWSSMVHVGVGNRNSRIASSADASRLAVAFSADGIYTSADSGATWTSNNAPPLGWTSIASSADGTRLVAVAGGGAAKGPVYTFTDASGWMSNTVATQSWTGVASSADGGSLAACTSASGIWKSQSTVAPLLGILFSGGETNISWIIPSTPFVLQQNDDLVAGTWTDVTDLPVLNPANLCYELSISPTNSQDFFRLAQP